MLNHLPYFILGPENIFVHSQHVVITAIIMETNDSRSQQNESQPLRQCAKEMLNNMNELLIVNKFKPFGLGKTNTVLEQLDTDKDIPNVASKSIIWLNHFMFPSPSNKSSKVQF